MDQLMIDTKQAARLIDVSPAHFHVLVNSGKIGPMPIRLSRRVLWRRDELKAWVDAGCPGRQAWQTAQAKAS